MEAIDMKENVLIDIHRSALNNYLELFTAESDSVLNISVQDVAFSVLQHAGMLYRYTADSTVLDSLMKLDTQSLLERGFEYVQSLVLIEQLKKTMRVEPVNDYQIMDLEYMIGVREELEAFCNTAQHLMADGLAKGDLSFVSDLAAARAYAGEFDRIAGKDPALLSVAAESFSDLKNLFAIECNRKDYWWLYISESYARAEESFADGIKCISDKHEVRTALNSHIADLFSNPYRQANSIYVPAKDSAIIHSIRFEEVFEKELIPAAAADESQAVSAAVLWDGVSNCFSICEANGEGVPEEGRYYARVVNPITHSEDGNALVEWKIHGFDFAGRESTTFYLIARDTRKVVGTGSVDSEGYAVLTNSFWDELNYYSSCYEKLMLLVIIRDHPPAKKDT